MSRFGSGKTFAPDSKRHQKEEKHVTVTNIKGSSEKGMSRVVGREKTGMRKGVGIDIPMSEVKKIKRKETYTFRVEEKRPEKSYGREKSKSTGFKTYYCDEAPVEYGGGGGSQFKSFSDSGRLNSGGRTKFI